jgi:hypothetical protein
MDSPNDSPKQPGLAEGQSSDERYRIRLGEFATTVRELMDVLEEIGESVASTHASLNDGHPVSGIVLGALTGGGPDVRKRLHSRMRDVERSMQVLRGESFRIVVDDGHMTITEAARRGGISLQMASRLYRVAGDVPLPCRPQ